MWYLYKTRIKCLLKGKECLFWSIFFPIILAMFFYIALPNALKPVTFDTIEVAVVKEESQQMEDLTKIMKEVSWEDGSKMFLLHEVSKEQAEEMLQEKEVSGIITYQEQFSMQVANSGINETLLKTFLEEYEITSKGVVDIMTNNPNALQQGLMESMQQQRDFLVDESNGKEADVIVVYFYALLAMATLFGSNWGEQEIKAIQADQSPLAARINIAPVHKMKVLFVNFMAAFTIQGIAVLLLIGFLQYVLGIQFGSELFPVIVISMVGCICGITLGGMISVLVKKEGGLRNAIMSAVVMVGCFLAGLMMVEMKYIVAEKAPFLQYINPANLIADGYYSLFYFESYERYFLDLGLLAGFTVIFSVVTYCVVRRKQYASI